MIVLNGFYNIDNKAGMAEFPDGYFDLAVDDPPYYPGPNKSGYYGKGFSSIGIKRAKHYSGSDFWQVPGPEYFKELKRVSKHQIIWGANHFAGSFNSSSSSWIVWDKVNGDSSFADAELAYSSFGGAVRMFRYMWDGMRQGKSISEGHIMQGNKSKNEKRIHPTQKPVALYKWILSKYAKPGFKILDPHAGSGSSIIACIDMGFEYVGFEKDRICYSAAVKRINEFKAQLKIF